MKLHLFHLIRMEGALIENRSHASRSPVRNPSHWIPLHEVPVF